MDTADVYNVSKVASARVLPDPLKIGMLELKVIPNCWDSEGAIMVVDSTRLVCEIDDTSREYSAVGSIELLGLLALDCSTWTADEVDVKLCGIELWVDSGILSVL